MGKTGIIIAREYLTRVRKKSFILMTFLGPLLIAGAMALIVYLGLQDDRTYKILVIDDTGGAFQQLTDGESFKFFSVPDLDIDDAKKAFKDSEYTCILHIPEKILSQNSPLLYFKDQPSSRIQTRIENKLERIVEKEKLKLYNMNYDDYRRIKTDFEMALIKFTEKGEEQAVIKEKGLIGLVFGVAVYMFIFIYGIQVMRGVMEEKSNRIVEVIVSSVKPFQLMLGKIIGIALVSLTQFILWIILTAALITVSQGILFQDKLTQLSSQEQVQKPAELKQAEKLAEDTVNFGDIIHPDHFINRINWPLMLGLFLFYFLGGYLLYSALFAAIGAAIDNETDSQQFMIPVTIPLMAAYFIALTLMENPDSKAGFWASIIPLTSPIIMIERVAIGLDSSQYWELILSMVLLVLGFLFTLWVAAKIYRTGILMYGKKVNYKELWKWIKYND